MNRDNRRTLLKGVAITLPAAWAPPVVNSIVLPAHAQTSPDGCAADADCYAATTADLSFDWPGGSGPFTVTTFEGAVCGGEPFPGGSVIVVAASFEEAVDALSCDDLAEGFEAFPLETVPPLTGCSFFVCAGEATLLPG